MGQVAGLDSFFQKPGIPTEQKASFQVPKLFPRVSGDPKHPKPFSLYSRKPGTRHPNTLNPKLVVWQFSLAGALGLLGSGNTVYPFHWHTQRYVCMICPFTFFVSRRYFRGQGERRWENLRLIMGFALSAKMFPWIFKAKIDGKASRFVFLLPRALKRSTTPKP